MRFFPGNLGRPRYLATLRTYRYLERVTKPPEDLQANPEAQRAVVNFLFADKLGIIPEADAAEIKCGDGSVIPIYLEWQRQPKGGRTLLLKCWRCQKPSTVWMEGWRRWPLLQGSPRRLAVPSMCRVALFIRRWSFGYPRRNHVAHPEASVPELLLAPP